MIKILSIFSMLFPTISSNISIGIPSKIKEEIKVDNVNNSEVEWNIKDWETYIALYTFDFKNHKIVKSHKYSCINFNVLGIQPSKIYVRTKTNKLGYGWSEGSSKGYQSTDLYCDGWYENNIEVVKDQKRKEEVTMTYFTNADGYIISKNYLSIEISFSKDNIVNFELEAINYAETFKVFSWVKTGATFNFDFIVGWEK